jgi:hypothetical protein
MFSTRAFGQRAFSRNGECWCQGSSMRNAGPVVIEEEGGRVVPRFAQRSHCHDHDVRHGALVLSFFARGARRRDVHVRVREVAHVD